MNNSNWIALVGVIAAAVFAYANIVIKLNEPEQKETKAKTLNHLYFIFIAILPVTGAIAGWFFDRPGIPAICMSLVVTVYSINFYRYPEPPHRSEILMLVIGWSGTTFIAVTYFLTRIASALTLK